MAQAGPTAEEIVSREAALHDKWPRRGASYSKDGAVDAATFAAEPVRLLFVLKEPNAESTDADKVRETYKSDLRRFLADGGRAPTWDGIACWAHALRALWLDEPAWKWETYEAELKLPGVRGAWLKRIAFMN